MQLIGDHYAFNISLDHRRPDHAYHFDRLINGALLRFYPLHVAKLSELTITNLINGVTEEFSDMGTMIKNEEGIKKACESFKNRLLVMATFGEQVIEY